MQNQILNELRIVKEQATLAANAARDNHTQITGHPDEWPGWDLRWLVNAAKKRDWKKMTLVEMQACLLAATDEERKAIKEANKPE